MLRVRLDRARDSVAAFILVSGAVPAIERIDASGAGAAGVDGIGGRGVRDARGLCALLLAYAAQDRGGEVPDIVPGSRRLGWLPRFGNQAQTAIGQFSVRTLVRSRQHRMTLAFYLGIGLAITSLMLKGSRAAVSNPWHE
jgi:hypothetical protein